jgi:hypothetical protein
MFNDSFEADQFIFLHATMMLPQFHFCHDNL